MELKILDSNTTSENIEEYKNIEYSNKYGYKALHLAVIANKYDLAETLIQSGFDVYEQTQDHLTSLQLFSNALLNNNN